MAERGTGAVDAFLPRLIRWLAGRTQALHRLDLLLEPLALSEAIFLLDQDFSQNLCDRRVVPEIGDQFRNERFASVYAIARSLQLLLPLRHIRV